MEGGKKPNKPEPMTSKPAVRIILKQTTSTQTTQATPKSAQNTPPPAAIPPTQPQSRLAPRPTTATTALNTKSSAPAAKALAYPQVAATGVKASKAKVYRNPRKLARGHNGTHRPIGPRGSVVLIKDNAKLDRSKIVAGKAEPEKLTIRFKDTNGDFHEHAFPGKTENKWNDDAWVAALNKWRYQTISRKFKYDPTVTRGHRGKWSMKEKEFLKEELKKKVEQNGDRLLTEDWKEVAKAHNKKFVGTLVKKGDLLLHGIAVRDYTITERTHVAIRAAFEKMSDLTQMVSDMVAEYTDDEDEDEDEDGDILMTNGFEEQHGGELEQHGGELEHHLEDPSDDEDDGQRPASNQTGALLVEGVC